MLKGMIMKYIQSIIVLLIPVIFNSCANMPTRSNQITGSYTSGIKYEDYTISRLEVELEALNKRESDLVLAQDQRVKSSQVQAFWWGFGNGDGIEAAELARVRGEKDAVTKAIEIKRQQNK